jgi:prepilin-type N-terminal cleavage/methylation domain-containing protein
MTTMKSSIRNSRTRQYGGFSLVEVSLAIAIIAMGLLAVIGMLPHAYTSARDAADNTVAATIVQNFLSQVRSMSYTNAKPGSIARNLETYSSGEDIYYDRDGNQVTISSVSRYFYLSGKYHYLGTYSKTLGYCPIRMIIGWPIAEAAPTLPAAGTQINVITNISIVGKYDL